MSKIKLYSAKSLTVNEVVAPREFTGDVNNDALSQALYVYTARSHQNTSKTKTRGEIKATTKKVYRQKGTGNARHGAKSAPIFVGGGTAHGPKGIKRELSLSKKIQKVALKSSLVNAMKLGNIAFVSDLSKISKTKDAARLINKISKNKKITLVIDESDKAVKRYFANIKNVKVENYKDMNACKLFYGGKVLFSKAIFTKNEKKPAKGKATKK